MATLLVERDTAPTITGVITNNLTGQPEDLTGCQVYFQLRLQIDRRFRVDGLCTVTDAAAGAVSYSFDPGDLDFDGACYARFLVVYPDSRRQHTVPPLDVTVSPQ